MGSKYIFLAGIDDFLEQNNLIVVYEVSFWLTIYSGKIAFYVYGTIILKFASNGVDLPHGKCSVRLKAEARVNDLPIFIL